MPEYIVKIQGVDSLLFGDGRPFSADEGSALARTFLLPPPGPIAGFLRTRIGEANGWDWTPDTSQAALQIAVQGPVLIRNSEPVFPAPADALIYKPEKNGQDPPHLAFLRPLPSLPGGAGCDLPYGMDPLSAPTREKPESGYPLWPWNHLQRWLASPGDGTELPPKIEGLPRERRVHVQIDPETGRASDRMLYAVEYLGFYQAGEGRETAIWEIAAAIHTEYAFPLPACGALGGERRLATVDEAPNDFWPICPDSLRNALQGAACVRLILATPAAFGEGWKPGWLDDSFVGSPPGMTALTLRLVAAAVDRHVPVSGWDYQHRRAKPIRWLAPAGSVYFFKVERGDPGELAEEGWLQPVSDAEQDRRDGYGLALWGLWNMKGEDR